MNGLGYVHIIPVRSSLSHICQYVIEAKLVALFTQAILLNAWQIIALEVTKEPLYSLNFARLFLTNNRSFIFL